MHLLRVAGISTNGASAGAQTKLCEKNWSRAYCVPFTVEGLDLRMGFTNICKKTALYIYDLAFGGFVRPTGRRSLYKTVGVKTL